VRLVADWPTVASASNISPDVSAHQCSAWVCTDTPCDLQINPLAPATPR
jgi:hypothetical protein